MRKATSFQVIDVFTEKAQKDSDFSTLLTASLRQAKEIAQNQLDPELFKALPWRCCINPASALTDVEVRQPEGHRC